MSNERYKQYIEQSRIGKCLLEQHKLTDEGFWQIQVPLPKNGYLVEKPTPVLCFEGCLQDVIEHVVRLPLFWHQRDGSEIVRLVASKGDTP